MLEGTQSSSSEPLPESSNERMVRIRQGISRFPSAPAADAETSRQPNIVPVDVLTVLAPRDVLTLTYRLDRGSVLRASVSLDTPMVSATPSSSPERLEHTEQSAGKFLTQLLGLAMPGALFEPVGQPNGPRLTCWQHIVPQPRYLQKPKLVTPFQLVSTAAAATRDPSLPLFADFSSFTFSVCAGLTLLAAIAPAELRLRITAQRLSQQDKVHLVRTKEHIFGILADHEGRKEAEYERYMRYVSDLITGERTVCIGAEVGSSEQLSSQTVDLLSLGLFGSPADQGPVLAAHRLDLRGVWPNGWRMPRLLPTADEVRKLPIPPAAAVISGDLGSLVGKSLSGAPVHLRDAARDRHLYLIGATGTGKSTLLLNLFAQDVRSTDSVILVDPHGDLADDARELVPAEREGDLIWADASDPEGGFALNVLQGYGADDAAQRNYIANSLIRLLSHVMYAGVPEAFGPIFELYFRNALFLLMDAGGPHGSLRDFERVFAEEAYRKELLKNCTDEKVSEFWSGIAQKVTNTDWAINNIAPYIVCKLAQFTGNPVMRRLLCSKQPSLDFMGAMDSGKIVILKMPKGLLGQYDTELLCAFTVLRLAQAGMARASMKREERRRARIYIDEFQTCAGDGLADMLAESRKFGVSLVLANQSLGQVDGSGRHPNTGQAALANAANLIAFRVGAPDAARLGPWFAPDIDWKELCSLPDFHAVARLLQHGRPSPARTLQMYPPPQGP